MDSVDRTAHPVDRTADPGGLRAAWIAGWYAYGDDESRAFNALRSEVEASADAYVAALTPEATAPDARE